MDAFQVFRATIVVRVLRPPFTLAGSPAGLAAFIFPAVVLVICVTRIGQEPFMTVAALAAVESHQGILRIDCDTEDTLDGGGSLESKGRGLNGGSLPFYGTPRQAEQARQRL